MTNSIFGHRVLRREDPTMLTVADIDLDDLLPDPPLNRSMPRPLLARDVVRFVGEPIAAVLTETREQGFDAIEAIVVDYDLRPALVDPEAGLPDADGALEPAEDGVALLLFPDASDNLAMHLEARGHVADFDGCEVVLTQRIVNQRVAPAPIEPRSSTARWTEDGRLVQHLACQGVHPIRDQLARIYGLETDQVRVVCPDVGGGFGAKAPPYPEALLLGFLARRVGRPVRWMDTRTENMTGMGHGRGQVQHVTIGGSRDGRIEAYRLDVVQDAGAYPSMGAVLPWMTRMMLTGVYDVRNTEFSARSVVTTTTPTVAYRGAGRPEAAAAIERAVDLFATEIGMDPAEVRRRNFIAPDAFPYTTAMKTVYDSGDYEGALDRVLAASGYDELRAEQRRRRAAASTSVDSSGAGEDGGTPARLLGIGLATYVEITALGAGGDHATVEIRPDGSVLVTTGSNPYGQGHHTSWAMLVHDRLGIPMDRIEIVHGDTDIVPHGTITGGSRSVQIAGSSIHDAAGKVLDLARARAADLLEAAVEDIVLSDADDGPARFHVAGTPAIAVGWDEVATAQPEPLVGLSDFSAAQPTFPFGAHVAVVEIDPETGFVELVRLVAVDDAGRILNPMIAEGQVHGGLAQGAAQALLEEVRYDDDGNPLTANFADYGIISAAELPAFERVIMETPTPVNELGAKGIGESGTIGATPAVQNAVIDALAHLGVRHVDMPASPERVWRAIQDAHA